jgi:Fic family protein
MLAWYNGLSEVTLNEILEFHYKFECIHPFQDGNGRIGRLIMFRECLKNKIMPFIIEDSYKAFYYRGLSEFGNENDWLLDTCLSMQDKYRVTVNRLLPEFKAN